MKTKLRKFGAWLMALALAFAGADAYGASVAKIGAVEYPTLQAAFDAVKGGETIELLVDKLTVKDYGSATYGKYTEITAQGTEHSIGEAMTENALANVVLRKSDKHQISLGQTGMITIVGKAETGTEFGSLDFSGCCNITVRNLKFDAANAVTAIDRYNPGGSDTSKDGVANCKWEIVDDGETSSVIDAAYSQDSAKPAGEANSKSHDIVIDSCLFFGTPSGNKYAAVFSGKAGFIGSRNYGWVVQNCKFVGNNYIYLHLQSFQYGYQTLADSTHPSLTVVSNEFGTADAKPSDAVISASASQSTIIIKDNIFCNWTVAEKAMSFNPGNNPAHFIVTGNRFDMKDETVTSFKSKSLGYNNITVNGLSATGTSEELQEMLWRFEDVNLYAGTGTYNSAKNNGLGSWGVDPNKQLITYEPNGGANNLYNPIQYNGKRALTLLPATREGWMFDGWYDNKELEGTALAQIATTDDPQPLTLYAKWIPPAAEIFDADGNSVGTSASLAPAFEQVPADGTIKLLLDSDEDIALTRTTGFTLDASEHAYTGTITPPTGYELKDLGGGKFLFRQSPLCEVRTGDALKTECYSLADALAAATAGDTIKLLSDAEILSALAIAKDLTFDLNGKTLSSSGLLFTLGKAMLTLRNGSLVGGNGAISATQGYDRVLVLDGVSISATGSDAIAWAAYNSVIRLVDGSENAITASSAGCDGIYAYSGYYDTIDILGEGSLVVYGANDGIHSVYMTPYICAPNVYASGGKFGFEQYGDGEEGVKGIEGGYYQNDVSAYCSDAVLCLSNEDEATSEAYPFVVRPMTDFKVILRTAAGVAPYDTLAAALAAAGTDAATLTLCVGLVGDLTVQEGQSIVFDGGYAKLTGAISAPEGALTIRTGTFTSDPSAWLDYGKVAEEDAGTYTVVTRQLEPDANGVYHILTLDDLAAFRNMVNDGEDFAGKTVSLDATIDMSPIAAWTPIGTTGASFAGTFEGNNKKLVNMTVVGDSQVKGGLFKTLAAGSVVRKLWFEGAGVSGVEVGTLAHSTEAGSVVDGVIVKADCSVTATSYASGIVAQEAYGDIYNCWNYATVTSDFIAAGIVAYLNGSSSTDRATMTNCVNRGAVSGGNRAGGMVAHANSADVSWCYNTGTVRQTLPGSAEQEPAAGIAAIPSSGSVISYCLNTGRIESECSNVNCYSGGIAGATPGSASALHCENLGEIVANGFNASGVGSGLYGMTIKWCRNGGNVTAANSAGGISAQAQYGAASSEKCLNAGSQTGATGKTFILAPSNNGGYYYDGDTLKTAKGVVTTVEAALADLNDDGSELDFWKLDENGKIITILTVPDDPVEPVAEVTDAHGNVKGYGSLQAACASMEAGFKLKLLEDVTVEETSTISCDKTWLWLIEIDGNGKTITIAKDGVIGLKLGGGTYSRECYKAAVRDLTVVTADGVTAQHGIYQLGGQVTDMRNVNVSGSFAGYAVSFSGCGGADLDNCHFANDTDSGKDNEFGCAVWSSVAYQYPITLRNGSTISAIGINRYQSANPLYPRIFADGTSSIGKIVTYEDKAFAKTYLISVDGDARARVGAFYRIAGNEMIEVPAFVATTPVSYVAPWPYVVDPQNPGELSANVVKGGNVDMTAKMAFDTLEGATKAAGPENVITVVGDPSTMTAPAGWEFKTEGDVTTLVKKPVAEIVETGVRFKTLGAAFAAVQDGETIRFLGAEAAEAEVAVAAEGKAFALDLNGQSLASALTLESGKLTLTNGTVAATVAVAGGELAVADGAKVVGASAIVVRAGSLNVTGGLVQGLTTNAVLLGKGVGVTVAGGSFIAPDGQTALAYDEASVATGKYPANFIWPAMDAQGNETGYPLFSSRIPVDYIAIGYTAKDNRNGTWTVTAGSPEIKTDTKDVVVTPKTEGSPAPVTQEEAQQAAGKVKDSIVEAMRDPEVADLVGTGLKENVFTQDESGNQVLKDNVVDQLRKQAVKDKKKQVYDKAIEDGKSPEEAQQIVSDQTATITADVQAAITKNSASNTESHVEVKLETVEVTVSKETTEATILESTLTKATFDVKPIVTVVTTIDNVVSTTTIELNDGDALETPVRVRLWLDADFLGTVVKVTHKHAKAADEITSAFVQTGVNEKGETRKFVEVTWQRFSTAIVEAEDVTGKACFANGKLYETVAAALGDTETPLPADATIELLTDCAETGLALGENRTLKLNGHAFTGTLAAVSGKETVKTKAGEVFYAPEKIDVPVGTQGNGVPIRGFDFTEITLPTPGEGETLKDVQAAYLAQPAGNGNLRWQNYVLFGNNPASAPKLIPQIVKAETGFSTVQIKAQDGYVVNTPAKCGVGVKFQLMRSVASATSGFVLVGEPKDEPAFQVDVKTIGLKTYWKIQTIFETTEDLPTQAH